MNCLLCDKKMHHNKTNKYYYCVACHFVKCDKRGDNKIYNEKYANHYYMLEGKATTKKLMDIRFNWVREYAPKFTSLLDYGCCIGSFLRRAQGYYCCYGYDINMTAISIAKKIGGYVTYNHDRYMKYKTVTLFDVLEHFTNPVLMLKKIHSMMQRDSFIFISTPNSDIWPIESIPNSWRHFKPGEHLYFFNHQSLEIILKKAGFTPLGINYRETLVRSTYKKNIIGIVGKK